MYMAVLFSGRGVISVDKEKKIALNVSEVAELLGVSRPVVYQLMRRKDFPVFKIGSRTVVPRLALEEWANSQVK